MKEITRSKERIKQTGEVFTPLPLVDEILDKLPKECFTDPTKTFLEPACGDGNFLVRIIAYKIFHGSTPEQALSTTYGLDIMEDNIAKAKQRVLTHAFWASLNKDILIEHLSLGREYKIGRMDGHDDFCKKYEHIVDNNIRCENALEYDMAFGNIIKEKEEVAFEQELREKEREYKNQKELLGGEFDW